MGTETSFDAAFRMEYLPRESNIVVPKRRRALSPAQLITTSFAGAIGIGTLLLLLPVSHAPGAEIGFLTALFTATSAVCVTGLIVATPAETTVSSARPSSCSSCKRAGCRGRTAACCSWMRWQSAGDMGLRPRANCLRRGSQEGNLAYIASLIVLAMVADPVEASTNWRILMQSTFRSFP